MVTSLSCLFNNFEEIGVISSVNSRLVFSFPVVGLIENNMFSCGFFFVTRMWMIVYEDVSYDFTFVFCK